MSGNRIQPCDQLPIDAKTSSSPRNAKGGVIPPPPKPPEIIDCTSYAEVTDYCNEFNRLIGTGQQRPHLSLWVLTNEGRLHQGFMRQYNLAKEPPLVDDNEARGLRTQNIAVAIQAADQYLKFVGILEGERAKNNSLVTDKVYGNIQEKKKEVEKKKEELTTLRVDR